MNYIEANKYGKLNKNDLECFEKEYEIELPNSYREYLLKYNGGGFPRAVFFISKEQGDSSIRYMFGIHNGPTELQLKTAMHILRKLYDTNTKGYVPIGIDISGCFLCIRVAGGDIGGIYFADRNFGDFIKISNNFSAFIANLTADDLA